jgi:hypothetical protein
MKLLSVSTGTLGGAFLMLFINGLLGDKAPWFIERLHARVLRDYSISFNVDDVAISQAALAKVSPDDYTVDVKEGFLFRRPPPTWKVESQNPGHVLEGISLTAIPVMGQSFGAFASLFSAASPQPDDLVTTTISPGDKVYEIGFTRLSKIYGLEVAMNPAADPEFVRLSLAAGSRLLNQGDSGEVADILKGESPEAREKLSEVSAEMTAFYGELITNHWPQKQKVADRIVITTFSKQSLSRSPVARLMLKTASTHLMTNFGILSMTNPALVSAAIQHIGVSKRNDVILLDASVPLDNIEVDRMPVVHAELGRTVLIVDRPQRINVVAMEYFNGPGSAISRLKELETVMLSFRVVK